MPLRIRWSSKEYLHIALLMLGACGVFQVLFIFLGQYVLSVGNHLVVILIPIGVTFALYYGAIIIFEAYAQVERKKSLKSQFQKSRTDLSSLQNFLDFPITKPLLILFSTFTGLFFIVYFIILVFLDTTLSFLLAELIPVLICLLIANYIEKKYARVKRY